MVNFRRMLAKSVKFSRELGRGIQHCVIRPGGSSWLVSAGVLPKRKKEKRKVKRKLKKRVQKEVAIVKVFGLAEGQKAAWGR